VRSCRRGAWLSANVSQTASETRLVCDRLGFAATEGNGTLDWCRRFIARVRIGSSSTPRIATNPRISTSIERDTNRAKFWLAPVRLARSGGFGASELLQVERLVVEREALLLRLGMSTSPFPSEVTEARAQRVSLTDDALVLELVDGRTISVPLAWYPRLAQGSSAERAHWRFIGEGEGIHWPDLDEDISIEGLLAGRRSGETQASLRRWLESRKAG
jgi:hypothetical protein